MTLYQQRKKQRTGYSYMNKHGTIVVVPSHKVTYYYKVGSRALQKLKDTQISQPQKIKDRLYLDKTMIKQIPHHIMLSIRELANSEREYAIGIDFEKEMMYPQEIISQQGKETTVPRISDVELFGHTHPSGSTMASVADIRGMTLLRPEFIVGGIEGSGIMFYNIEDYDQFSKWYNKNIHSQTSSIPLDTKQVPKKLRHLLGESYGRNAFLLSEEGREIFFKQTGVQTYPYEKGMTIELKEDKIPEERYEKKHKTLWKQNKLQSLQNQKWDYAKKRDWDRVREIELEIDRVYTNL